MKDHFSSPGLRPRIISVYKIHSAQGPSRLFHYKCSLDSAKLDNHLPKL